MNIKTELEQVEESKELYPEANYKVEWLNNDAIEYNSEEKYTKIYLSKNRMYQ